MRNLLLMAMLVGATSVFLLFWLSPPEVFLNKPASDTDDLPKADSYMLNVSILTYNDAGEKANSMLATEARHYKRGNRLEAENPDMVSYNVKTGAEPWHMTADKGTVYKGGEKAVFNGSVYAWQEDGEGGKKELYTDKLILHPDTHIAETDHLVTIITQQGKTTGVGMWSDLDAQIYKLLSNVKGVHRAL